ncbi:hypothetical protein B0H12DRAFT_1161167, partial [Mycena haematopus]
MSAFLFLKLFLASLPRCIAFLFLALLSLHFLRSVAFLFFSLCCFGWRPLFPLPFVSHRPADRPR